ncbi:TPA: Stealth CR1 domain-containing protein [Streptococcus suis]
MTDKIDFIITWVDGNDLSWQKSKQFFSGTENEDMNSIARFRDWEILQYWFRSVEMNAPWVNKIFFVTEGHVPKWLNTKNDKLVVLKHSDYIDSKYLPTFNSNVIELNFDKIPGLSRFFVNFNDDMFINSIVKETDFFENDLPKDSGIFSPIVPKRKTISSIVQNNIEIINDYFDSRKVLRSNFLKFFNLKYKKHLVKNLCILPWKNILGFYDNHIPVSYDLSIFRKVIKLEQQTIEDLSTHRFRTKEDINHWLVRYWQLCEGHFTPRSVDFGKLFRISSEIEQIENELIDGRHKVICLNDGDGEQDFELNKQRLISAFEKKFPEKSSFEI